MAIGCIKGAAVLSGFSYEKMYGCFTGTKTKKMAVITRLPQGEALLFMYVMLF